MEIKIRPGAGAQEAFKSIDKSVPIFHNGIRKGLNEVGQTVKRETKKLIRTGKRTGRVYIINGRRHQASAKGEAPANLSGALAKGVKFKTRNHYQMEIGDTVPYGLFLERKDIMDRPHLITAINNTNQENVNTLMEYVDEELKK